MRRVGDRFVLVRELGVGGMSRVYLGRDEVLDRPVAVKVLHPDLEGEDTGERFRREGRMAAKLSHPNIVQVYDAGEDALEGHEVSYIVMEYLSGGDLKALMDRRGALPEGMLSRLGADVAAALAHAHERGVIHRDIKPQNVLLDDRGNPKLADFGVARAFDTTKSTQSGSYLGTAAYSSPEQLRGDKVTPKADVYALGVTLYEAAVGEPPFSGAPIEVANQHILKKPEPPRERGAPIGRGLETLILDCLEKDPRRRPEAFRVYEKLLQRGGAGPDEAPATPGVSRRGKRPVETASAVAGLARAVGTARSAGASGLDAIRKKLDRGPSYAGPGPPEITISVPTRTFRAGSRQRALILLVGATLALLLLVGGAWAMLASGGEQTPSAGANEQRQAAAGQAEQEQANEPTPDASNASEASDNAGPETAPAPPLRQAQQAVYRMYYQASFWNWGASYGFLSQRKKQEEGSPAQWGEQFSGINYVEYPMMPRARADGDEARVKFQVVLSYDTRPPETITGTWVCVNENGEWRLDRLENNRTTT